jgi:hypothetical protein
MPNAINETRKRLRFPVPVAGHEGRLMIVALWRRSTTEQVSISGANNLYYRCGTPINQNFTSGAASPACNTTVQCVV